MLSKRFLEDLERQRNRAQEQVTALDNVLKAFTDEPRGAQAHTLTDERRANISKGVRRAYARKNRARTRISWPERKRIAIECMRRGPTSITDLRKETGWFETLTRNTLEALVEEGVAVKGAERVGANGSFLYMLTGRQARVTQEAAAQASLR